MIIPISLSLPLSVCVCVCPQISKKALMSRKITLFMKSVNPVELSMALSGVYAGLVAVVAALQLEFARTVAFGATIGEVLAEPIVKCSRPGLKKVVPEVHPSVCVYIYIYVCV
jgi:hypothetical protein